VPDATRLTAAQGDLTIAYNNARDRTPVPVGTFLNPGSGDLAGLNLVPGIYKFTGAALISSDVTLTGSDTSVWIFQIGSSLSVPDGGIKVILAGGAKAANIFWQVGTSAALGTTADFKGTIMADQSITLAGGARLDGRALARIAAVTLSANVITVPVIAPVPTTPIQGALNVPVSNTLRWAKSSWAATYRVQLSTDSTFATTLVNDSTVTDTSRAVGPLANNTTYYWRVYAKNAAGTSLWSTRRSFTTIVAAPVAPALNSPAQNATLYSASAILTWNASARATTYHVQVSYNPGFTILAIDDSTLTATTKTLGAPNYNTVYYWRVNAINIGGTSAYSETRTFTLASVGILPREFLLQRLNLGNDQPLRFSLPQKEHVVIKLFSTQGRMVSQLLNETRDAGSYTMPLSAGLKSSCYFLDFRAGDFHRTMRINP
jgi:transposase-like protein